MVVYEGLERRRASSVSRDVERACCGSLGQSVGACLQSDPHKGHLVCAVSGLALALRPKSLTDTADNYLGAARAVLLIRRVRYAVLGYIHI